MLITSKSIFTCSNSIIETLEKHLKQVQRTKKKTPEQRQ